MKKILGIVVGIFFLAVLAGCQSKTTATATFYDVDLQQTAITFSVEVTDPDSEITGIVTVKLLKPDGSIAFYKEMNAEVDYENITFSNLDNSLTYTLEVHATVGRNSIVIGTATYSLPTASTIHITTTEEFLAMNANRAGNYVLDNDLDFTDVDFTSPFSASFSGTFDGQGNTISNVTFNKITTYTGIFGYVSSGSIENLVIDNVTIGTEAEPLEMITSSRVGILAGYVSSATANFENITITNSEINYSTSSTVQAFVGGIAGEFRAVMTNVSLENVKIGLTSTSYGKIKVGGAVGLLSLDAKIKEVFADTNIHFVMAGSALKNRDVSINIGGLFGDNNAINNIKSVQDVAGIGNIVVDLDFGTTADTTTANYAVYVGGIAGFAMTNTTNAFYGGSIELNHAKNDNEALVSKTFFVGGLFGFYGSNKLVSSVIRYGDLQTIDITVSDDVTLKASQTFGEKIGTTVHTVGIIGDLSLNINSVSEVLSDPSTVYTDITDFFTSEWIQETFAQNVINTNA